jgi:hypothetical protein
LQVSWNDEYADHLYDLLKLEGNLVLTPYSSLKPKNEPHIFI